MTAKEGFVNRHTLETNDSLARFQLGDGIHQEKRIAMGDNLLYLIGIQEHRSNPESDVT